MAAEVAPLSFLRLRYVERLEIQIQIIKCLLRIVYDFFAMSSPIAIQALYTELDTEAARQNAGEIVSLLMIIANVPPVNITFVNRR
jgi:hypothetical protein